MLTAPWMVPGETNYSAVDSPGGPLLGGTNCSMTDIVLKAHAPSPSNNQRGYLKYLIDIQTTTWWSVFHQAPVTQLACIRTPASQHQRCTKFIHRSYDYHVKFNLCTHVTYVYITVQLYSAMRIDRAAALGTRLE